MIAEFEEFGLVYIIYAVHTLEYNTISSDSLPFFNSCFHNKNDYRNEIKNIQKIYNKL